MMSRDNRDLLGTLSRVSPKVQWGSLNTVHSVLEMQQLEKKYILIVQGQQCKGQ
jgi:hypothetical protein